MKGDNRQEPITRNVAGERVAACPSLESAVVDANRLRKLSAREAEVVLQLIEGGFQGDLDGRYPRSRMIACDSHLDLPSTRW
jgi:hypothetical protein